MSNEQQEYWQRIVDPVERLSRWRAQHPAEPKQWKGAVTLTPEEEAQVQALRAKGDIQAARNLKYELQEQARAAGRSGW